MSRHTGFPSEEKGMRQSHRGQNFATDTVRNPTLSRDTGLGESHQASDDFTELQQKFHAIRSQRDLSPSSFTINDGQTQSPSQDNGESLFRGKEVRQSHRGQNFATVRNPTLSRDTGLGESHQASDDFTELQQKFHAIPSQRDLSPSSFTINDGQTQSPSQDNVESLFRGKEVRQLDEGQDFAIQTVRNSRLSRDNGLGESPQPPELFTGMRQRLRAKSSHRDMLLSSGSTRKDGQIRLLSGQDNIESLSRGKEVRQLDQGHKSTSETFCKPRLSHDTGLGENPKPPELFTGMRQRLREKSSQMDLSLSSGSTRKDGQIRLLSGQDTVVPPPPSFSSCNKQRRNKWNTPSPEGNSSPMPRPRSQNRVRGQSNSRVEQDASLRSKRESVPQTYPVCAGCKFKAVESAKCPPDDACQKGKHTNEENVVMLGHNQSKKVSSETDNSRNSQTNVTICVKKSFHSPSSFKQFIRMVEEKLDFGVDVVDESISLTADASKCVIKTKSWEHAIQVKKMCFNLQLGEKYKIVCDLQKSETNAQRAIEDKISKALSSIQTKRKEAMHSHEDKMNTVQQELDELHEEEFKLSDNFDKNRKRALTDKLKELRMQQSEFNARCDELLRGLKKIDQSAPHTKEIDDLKKSVGIEYNRLRNALPIYARRSEIIRYVNSNQVAIILGETGSGKSTQMVQYFYDANLCAHGTIVCTQPRRVAASTLGVRVAEEMSDRVGGLVGYKASSEKKAGRNTKIMFTTDYTLLNECLEDPDLKKYSCIIVDEAHERSIYTDILLGMLKICLTKRPDLKLVITSATINPEVFIKYFKTGHELRISGRTFPVEMSYSEDASDDFDNYEKRALFKAIELHQKEGPGDILVFLCSPVEIMRCCEEFQKKMSGDKSFKCLPLHGQLPADEQQKVFKKLPEGQRKVIFSTNCAETSITIDGIKYVIDTGVAKEMKYDPKRNINQLGTFVISKSSADQRKGRAGRTSSGKCYRLYSQEGFDLMDNINEPEILRVHLGQAVLKLADLGVNIKTYDFVQAPSETALQSALNTLCYLGAINVRDNSITDTGKWISKLPFDPKLGYFIYEADKINLLYDAVVLAAVISTGSDLFYRGFSETEAQVVAKSKSYFSSEFGDSFTWFNIYKAWKDIPKTEKSGWCRSHCINYKSMGYAHQNINEVKISLSRHFEIDMSTTFSTDASTFNHLRRILFEANVTSLCNFSGAVKAGYFCLALEHQVYVHPSSILNALDLKPEWVVYNELMKTSKEFIKGITIVEEEWVQELIASGRLGVDLSKAEKQKLSRVYQEEVGSSIFRAIVGPRFSHLREIEEELSNSGMAQSVLTVTKELGTVEVYSSQSMSHSVIAKLKGITSSITEKLMLEESEFKMNKDDTLNASSFRVMLGSGGCVKTILMPHQSTQVVIKRKNPCTSEEDIIKKFDTFGYIKDKVKFKNSHAWGFIRYNSVTEANAAVEATGQDEFNAGALMLEKQSKSEKNMFEAKVTWLRRPVQGKGMAFVKCDPLDRPLLSGQSISLSTGQNKIQVSKKDESDLIIFNTGLATEENIEEAIINMLNGRQIENVKVKVSLVRQKVPVTPNLEQTNSQLISAFIRKYVDEDHFKLRMLPPKPSSIYYVGFLNFTDPIKGYEICQNINQELCMKGQAVKVAPCLKTTVHVSKRIRAACQVHFDEIFACVAEYKDTKLTWRNLTEDFSIDLQSSEPKHVVEVRDLLNKVIEGEIIVCTNHGCLLTKAGQEYLKKIERNSSCFINTDFHKEKIHIYGPDSNVSEVLHEIKSYLTEIKNSKQGLFYMKGHGKAPGLVKVLINKFGPNLEQVIEKCGLKSISINWKNLSIQFLGSDLAVDKANQMLAAEEDVAWKNTGQARKSSLPECSVCMCPVDENESIYRMEVCGHAYCMECLNHQVSFAVNNKEFPLTCAKEGCKSPFVMRDLKFTLSKKWIDEGKLTSMAVNAFILANKDKYKFCTSPNCPAVYEVTPREASAEFTCPICCASICTSCHNAFHSGLTCDMAQNDARAEAEMMSWLAANPTQRKRCPGCQWPIEKTEGCQKMHCSSCNTFFCWLCLHISANEQDCYRHLHHAHGGFN